MIDNISLFAMKARFSDVHDLMNAVEEYKQEYMFKDGRLTVFMPAYVLIVECVDTLLLYSLIHKSNWNKLQDLIMEYDIGFDSLACFANANHWSVSDPLSSLYSTYSLTMSNVQHVMNAGINLETINVVSRIEPTIFGDITYALVGVADNKPAGEYGVSDTTTIYGIFNNLKWLREAFVKLRERIGQAEENAICEAQHEFAIHAFVPNRCFGFGTDISMSFFIE